ncbi:MAG TPA: copper-binding protein [Pseudolabrys sp.]|jgi:Cu/Ag efflux protein CusF
MRYAGTLLAAALVIGASGLSYAQETIKGKVAAVDEPGGKIAIQINGTSGAGASMAPTSFKVQDALLFNAVKPGDQVVITTENVNGVPTIKSLQKE